MTVALTNFNPNPNKVLINGCKDIEWHSSLFIGSGKDFILKVIPKDKFKEIAKLIKKQDVNLGEKFINEFDKKFFDVIGKTDKFQDAYVENNQVSPHEPSKIIAEVGSFIMKYKTQNQYMELPSLVPERDKIPTRHVLAMYAINRIIS